MRSFVKKDSRYLKREIALKNNLKKRKNLKKIKKKINDSSI